ncbi:acetate/propionate family kinase [Ideonella paludis]|uniref:Acetate kinase n=1 Tax=Ideonella paludis TaxID=1233411 RepID=A0ABS5E015_9BURK|nr:acetate/propionate family kinase [Ideonella paludis]
MRERFEGQPAVLAVNAGSSSLKCGLYPAEGPARWTCTYEGLEPGGQPRLKAEGQSQPLPASAEPPMAQALTHLVSLLSAAQVPLQAVAHRIVHGGSVCVAPCLLDAPTLDALAALNPLAPLHQPHNLAGVAAFAHALPGVPQVGCFDTAFHAHLPPLEQRLPLPSALAEQGLRRYGFHGLSYQYVSEVLAARSPCASGRAILAHLGNGASLCATQGGVSVATTMGFSALDGLMMGSRSGSLDPGVLLHLWRQGWSHTQVEELLYKDSGLKGVSGLSADMRTLRASPAPAAQEAIALFTRRIVREMGGLVALLGGVDLIAFTGGIGEHDALLRAEVARALAYLGVKLDGTANQAASGDSVQALQAADSAVELWVVPTDEGRAAARAAMALLAG